MQDTAATEQAGARRSLKERLMGPATETPFTVGQLGVAAASGVGIGALCFYGLGFGKEAGAIDRMGYVHGILFLFLGVIYLVIR